MTAKRGLTGSYVILSKWAEMLNPFRRLLPGDLVPLPGSKEEFELMGGLWGFRVPSQIGETRMADQVDQLNELLDDHTKAIETIEGFMAEFARRAEVAVDPTRLQPALDKIKEHNSRLAALLAKFPLVK